jgi:hypothetical protein
LKNEIGVSRLEIANRCFKTTLPEEIVLLSTEMFIEGTAVKPSGSNGQDFTLRRVCRDGKTVERTEGIALPDTGTAGKVIMDFLYYVNNGIAAPPGPFLFTGCGIGVNAVL